MLKFICASQIKENHPFFRQPSLRDAVCYETMLVSTGLILLFGLELSISKSFQAKAAVASFAESVYRDSIFGSWKILHK